MGVWGCALEKCFWVFVPCSKSSRFLLPACYVCVKKTFALRLKIWLCHLLSGLSALFPLPSRLCFSQDEEGVCICFGPWALSKEFFSIPPCVSARLESPAFSFPQVDGLISHLKRIRHWPATLALAESKRITNEGGGDVSCIAYAVLFFFLICKTIKWRAPCSPQN